MAPKIRRRSLVAVCALAAALSAGPGAAEAPAATPTRAPTAVPTPQPPERLPASPRRGAVTERRVARYENRNVTFSRLTRVEEVDLDGDGVFEALVEGIGTVRSFPADVPSVGFVSRARLPFENPLFAVFQRGRGGEWNLLLLGHLPLRCGQNDDPAKCDELLSFRSVRFRFDDRPQVALQVLHSGEPHLLETQIYRLDRGRLEPTFSIAVPRAGVEVAIGPEGLTRRIAVDTFINKELPTRYRSFTLTTAYVFGERKFRVYSESVEPEWSDRGDLDLSYWGLVQQSSFFADVARLSERQRKAAAEAPWSLDPAELVRKRFPDAREVRVGVKQSGVAIVYFERIGCSAHIVLFQPMRASEGEHSLWEFAVIRAPEEPAYECLGEPPMVK